MLKEKILIACFITLTGLACRSEIKKSDLPEYEKRIMNTVDHWRLGFFDQVQRFEKAEKSFKKLLGPNAPKSFMTGIQTSLVKTPLNKYWFKGKYTNKVKLSAAKNEYESFQLAVIPFMGKKLKKVALSSGSLKEVAGKTLIPADAIKIYHVGRIKTVEPYYPNRMFDNLWPDPLEPNTPQAASKTDIALFWIQVKVPKNISSGNYAGKLQLVGDGEKLSIEINLHVYNFTLPDRVPFPVAVWTRNPKKADMDYYRKIFAEFLKHGIDPISVGELYKAGSPGFKEFDKNIKFCLKHKQQVFEINKPRHGILYKHLKENGWLEKAIVYTNQDEPDPEQFKTRNIPYYEKMKKLYPGLRIFMASEYQDKLDKGCDIWLNDLSTARGMKFAAKHKGKAVLWNYYCGIPIKVDYCSSRENQPLMLIERDSIEHRLPFWIAWKYGVKGIFIYAGNNASPRKIPNSNYWQVSQKGRWPYCGTRNGDGFIMYPGCMPSIRMKILRDGLEDYGYFMALKKALPQIKNRKNRQRAEAILKIPGQVMIDPHYFNRNPACLLNIREEIGIILDEVYSKYKKRKMSNEKENC